MINPANADNIVRHIEIKAYVDDYQSLCSRVAGLTFNSSIDGISSNNVTGDSSNKSANKRAETQFHSHLRKTSLPVDRVQDDTFFHCRSGRLKLRSSGQFHDLIYYRRENDYGPSESFYQSARTINPAALRSSLTSAFGEAGRVKKFRRTYRVGAAIVHLDRVGGLGDFIEIKVELDNHLPGTATETSLGSQSTALSASKGAQLVENIMSALGVDLFQLVDGAYIDLINEQARNTSKSVT